MEGSCSLGRRISSRKYPSFRQVILTPKVDVRECLLITKKFSINGYDYYAFLMLEEQKNRFVTLGRVLNVS